MATCKECLHRGVCKDRDNLMLTVNNIFELMYQNGVEHSCVHFKSIADVVPRAEVEAMQRMYGEKLDVAEALIATLNKSKTNVAWEIFDEVDEIAYHYLNDADYSGGDMIYDLNELKKKYTEGANENKNL